MNDVGLSTRLPDPVVRARALGPAISAVADEIEKRQDFPEPLISELHESRLFRLLLPRSLGGEEVEPWVYVAAIEEIARHDGSLGWNMFVANSSALIAPFIPFEAARTIYGDPRGLISWGPPNQNKLVAAPGGYRVTGEWHFSSGYRQATWIGAHGNVVEPDGSLRLQPLRPADRANGPHAQGGDEGDPRLAHARHARHGLRRLLRRRRLRAGSLLRHARGSDAAPRQGPALCLHHAGPLCLRRGGGGARHRARHARRLHRARRHQDAALSRRGSPTIPASSPTWRAARPTSARRAPG